MRISFISINIYADSSILSILSERTLKIESENL